MQSMRRGSQFKAEVENVRFPRRAHASSGPSPFDSRAIRINLD